MESTLNQGWIKVCTSHSKLGTTCSASNDRLPLREYTVNEKLEMSSIKLLYSSRSRYWMADLNANWIGQIDRQYEEDIIEPIKGAVCCGVIRRPGQAGGRMTHLDSERPLGIPNWKHKHWNMQLTQSDCATGFNSLPSRLATTTNTLKTALLREVSRHPRAFTNSSHIKPLLHHQYTPQFPIFSFNIF